jgi:hypothetical protein
MGRWDFEVTAYYRKGGVAMITTHVGEHSKDMEVAAFRSRPEIGYVKVRDLRLSKLPPRFEP